MDDDEDTMGKAKTINTLKPCPFCGDAAAIEERDYGHGFVEYHAYCVNPVCSVATVEYLNENHARDAWNARTHQAEINKASHIIVEDAAEITRLRAALAEAERDRDEARAALEILRNTTVAMPAWVCPKCGRSHPMTESGCPCLYDNIKITTGTVSTPRRIEPRFDDERGQAGKGSDNG